MDIDIPVPRTETLVPLNIVTSTIDARPGTDDGAGGGTAGFMPGSRDPLGTVITAVAVSVRNDSGVLFNTEGFTRLLKDIVVKKIALVKREDSIIKTYDIPIENKARLNSYELVIALIISLPISLLKD